MDSAGLETARRTLRQRLLAMVGVQSVSIPLHEPYIVVQMWTGVVFHVHFLAAPVKTRQIRRILQEATDNGIGVMFFVSRLLMPEANLRIAVPEWMLALHALTHERIYTIELKDGEIALSQLHFDPIGSSGDMGANYGPAPKLEQLRFLRASIKPRYIKGDWQLADFGADAFWKDPYQRRSTPSGNTYRRPDPREYEWKSWTSSAGWEQSRTQDIPRPSVPSVDRLVTAYTLLKIERGATRDEIRAAYRRLALDYHPDTSTLPKAEAEARFRELTEAYEFIRVTNKWT